MNNKLKNIITSLRGGQMSDEAISLKNYGFTKRDCHGLSALAMTSCKFASSDYSGRSVFHSASENLSIFFRSIRLSLLRVSQLRCSLYRKSAFTFAELMISLVVIAVITLILYPTISDLAPNNNEYLFKSAYKTIEMVTSDIMNTPNTSAMPFVGVAANPEQSFCQAYCEKLNVISTSNVDADGNPINTCPGCTYFTTSNGMRWAFAISGSNGYILVDVNASNNKTGGTWTNETGFNADPWQSGAEANKGVNRTGDPITMDTFDFEITPEGKIGILDGVGIDHMKNPSN